MGWLKKFAGFFPLRGRVSLYANRMNTSICYELVDQGVYLLLFLKCFHTLKYLSDHNDMEMTAVTRNFKVLWVYIIFYQASYRIDHQLYVLVKYYQTFYLKMKGITVMDKTIPVRIWDAVDWLQRVFSFVVECG